MSSRGFLPEASNERNRQWEPIRYFRDGKTSILLRRAALRLEMSGPEYLPRHRGNNAPGVWRARNSYYLRKIHTKAFW